MTKTNRNYQKSKTNKNTDSNKGKIKAKYVFLPDHFELLALDFVQRSITLCTLYDTQDAFHRSSTGTRTRKSRTNKQTKLKNKQN